MSRLFAQGLISGTRIQATPRLFPSVASSANYYIKPRIGQVHQNTLSSIQVRHLYTDYALGLQTLDRLQIQKNQLFAGAAKDRYLERLIAFRDQNDLKSVYRDDLFNLIGIAENDEHLALLEDLIDRTKDDPQVFTKGLGVMVMRLYKKLDKLDRALESLKNVDRYGDFFLQRFSYKIVMTMLFNAGRYREVVDIYHLADEKLTQVEEDSGEQILAPLAFAALAKMDTEEAFSEARQLFDKLSESRPQTGATKSIQFVTYMAVKYNEPKYALHLISRIRHGYPLVVKELKVRSLTMLERYEDIPIQLREFINNVRRDTAVLLKSTCDTIEQYLDKVPDPNVRKEMGDILVEIKDGGHIMEANFDEMLYKEINHGYSPQTRKFGPDSGPPPRRYQGGYNTSQSDDGQDNRRSSYNNVRGRDRPYNNRQYNDRQYNDRSNRNYDEDHNQERGGDRNQNSRGKRFTYQNVDFSS